jgi:hypothetical protein
MTPIIINTVQGRKEGRKERKEDVAKEELGPCVENFARDVRNEERHRL